MINFEGNLMNKKVSKMVFDKLDSILPADDIKKLVDIIKQRAEFEIPEVGTFRTISENITNHKPVIQLGNISLNIKPTSKSNNSIERILEAVISTKSGQYTTEKILASGSRDDILKFVNDENFGQNFKKFLMDCSDSFERKGLE